MEVKKAKKPKHNRSQRPTLTGEPPLGYLNYFTCPVCGKHLFSYYDGDLKRALYVFEISAEWNYCSKCGTLLDLDEWKNKPDQESGEDELILEE